MLEIKFTLGEIIDSILKEECLICHKQILGQEYRKFKVPLCVEHRLDLVDEKLFIKGEILK